MDVSLRHLNRNPPRSTLSAAGEGNNHEPKLRSEIDIPMLAQFDNRVTPDYSWHIPSRDRQGVDSNHLTTP